MSLWGKIKAKITGKEDDVHKWPIQQMPVPDMTPAEMQKMYDAIFGPGYFTFGDAEPPEPLPEREQSKPLLGIRGWVLVEQGGRTFLRSVTAGDIWKGPILRAEAGPCEDRWTPVSMDGSKNRDLGIFAHSPVEGAYRTATEHEWPVVGLVELFGKVVVHERGFRAEACRIRELWVEPYAAKHRDALAELYQCEVHVQSLPTDAPLHVDDLPDPNECPMCGHEHPDEPLNCKESEDNGDRQAEGDRASEGAIRAVPWEGGRSRIPSREERTTTVNFSFGSPVSTGALTRSIMAQLRKGGP